VPAEGNSQDRSGILAETLQALTMAERVAAIGAVVVLGSTLLPWYGLRFLSSLSQTGLDAFGLAQAALALTALAALVLIVRCARGYRLPRPLSEGALLIAAGAWAALLVVYAMIDRPDDFGLVTISLRYGIFVALAGAVAIAVGGVRLRRERDRDETPNREDV
jgi:hypothetical protein